jgi:MHS family citrate/tricarballylate:H+ symporter-like MFS transporter
MSKAGSKVSRVIQVSSGSLFEAFDLIVFGTFITFIAGNFFPKGNDSLSLMWAFSTFASAYLMRFVGAVVLGPYFDHAGRRKGLLISFSLMAIGTGLIAIAPTYAMIGIFAPILLVVGRLIQGFSVGAETGGIVAYLSEIATPNKRALYVSWNATTFHLATLAAIFLGLVLNKYLSNAEMAAWGWRIPAIMGCGLIPIVFIMRKNLLESEVFSEQMRHPTMREVLITVAQNWRVALAGTLMIVLGSCIFYFIFTFMPVFEKENLGLTTLQSLSATVIAVGCTIFMVPCFAILSDHVGRFPILSVTAVLVIVTAYPTLRYLVDHPQYQIAMLAQLWLAALYSAYVSSSFVGLSERVPSHIRATGYGVSTTLGLAVFGGCTPLISNWLIHITGSNIAPCAWLISVALCSLVGSFILFKGGIALSGGEVDLQLG